MLASMHASHPVPSVLLATGWADANAQDLKGNTAMHYASAYGQLKTLRILLGGGGRPGVRNRGSWGAGSYSLSVQAEVYWKGLVADWERWVEVREGGRADGVAESVRLVRGEEEREGDREERVGDEDYAEEDDDDVRIELGMGMGRGSSALEQRDGEGAGLDELGVRQPVKDGRARADTE